MSDEIIFCETPEDVAEAAAELIFEKQTEAVAERGVFRIALSGGNTPKLLYQQLASEEWREEISWDRWEVYWSDERAVPPDHTDSNYHLAHSTFLCKVPVPKVFQMISPRFSGGTKGGLDQAAQNYETLLKDKFGQSLPVFDLILLGVGPDGHTASLFPEHHALESQNLVDVVDRNSTDLNVASLPPNLDLGVRGLKRLTLTLRVLNAARAILFLITGEEKAQAVKEILELGNRDLPATLVNPEGGECFWILDEAASHLLS